MELSSNLFLVDWPLRTSEIIMLFPKVPWDYVSQVVIALLLLRILILSNLLVLRDVVSQDVVDHGSEERVS